MTFDCIFRRVWIVLLLATSAHAASPTLQSVLPRGAQRGTEIEVTLAGDRLADAQELLFYEAGLSAKSIQVVSPQSVKLRLKVAPDAPLGEHNLRLRTASGVSELRTFWVGALPVVDEKESNSDFARPQQIELNTTIHGLIDNEDVDYFVVDLKKDQRFTAEVEGIRLGATMFDPYVAILDTNRFELAACDDSAPLLQDPIASFVAPKDGKYIVQLRESSYGGNGACHYRLHVGTFPRPRAIFPAGGPPGANMPLELIGDSSGPTTRPIQLPGEPRDLLPVFDEQNGQLAPSPNYLRVSSCQNVIEVEPNNDALHPMPGEHVVPVAFNGVLSQKSDVDAFRFIAKKDQPLDLNVYARRLRSPVDPVLYICNASDGKVIAGNDDSAGPDSYLRFVPPADGTYIAMVVDQLGGGAPDYVYRLEVTPAAPKLALTIPLWAPNSQDRQAMPVPRGNRFATLVRATRADFGGEVSVRLNGLPSGVTTSAEKVAPNMDVVPVVFEAAPDSPTSATLCDVIGDPVDPNIKLARSEFTQVADLVVFGNQVPFYQTRVNKLAVAVTDAAPFKISIVQPKVPIVQNGSMQLKIVAERASGFAGQINMAMLYNPQGIGSGGATIAPNTNEALLPLSCAPDAPPRQWNICVIGWADVNGPLWVSTQLVELEIAPPFVTGKLEMAATEQGKPAQMLCSFEQTTPFDGKATVQLVGLPPNTSTGPREITSNDAKLVFDIQTDAKAPTGQHNTLFCVVTVTKNGEPIVHNTAGGGVLRIDAPPPAAATPAPVAQAPSATPAPAVPLSRLQKLRMEAAAK